jgi:serine/threonine-protein kinase
MVYIPGGKFIMGYNGSDEESEKPEQEVTVAPFLIDQYEVTIEEYYRFIKARNHEPPNDWRTSWKEGQFKPEEPRLPVTNITWFDARAYAESVGKRLPSEAEWEYAARGTDKRLFPWGNDFDPKFANVGDPEKKALIPAGSYPQGKSPFGVFDMAGNAYEWTDSDSIPYPGSKGRPKPGKIIRGGSFFQKKVYAMTTTRGYLSPIEKLKDVGFRCAKDLPKQ